MPREQRTRPISPLSHLCAHGLALPRTCSMDKKAQHRVSVSAAAAASKKAARAAAKNARRQAARDRDRAATLESSAAARAMREEAAARSDEYNDDLQGVLFEHANPVDQFAADTLLAMQNSKLDARARETVVEAFEMTDVPLVSPRDDRDDALQEALRRSVITAQRAADRAKARSDKMALDDAISIADSERKAGITFAVDDADDERGWSAQQPPRRPSRRRARDPPPRAAPAVQALWGADVARREVQVLREREARARAGPQPAHLLRVGARASRRGHVEGFAAPELRAHVRLPGHGAVARSLWAGLHRHCSRRTQWRRSAWSDVLYTSARATARAPGPARARARAPRPRRAAPPRPCSTTTSKTRALFASLPRCEAVRHQYRVCAPPFSLPVKRLSRAKNH